MIKTVLSIWVLFVSNEPVAEFETLDGCRSSANYILKEYYPEISKVKCVRTTIIEDGRNI